VTGHEERGALMRAEIAEQPEVYAGLLDRSGDLRALHAEIRDRDPRFVLIAARGSSDHAALYAKYVVEVQLGLPAGLASPSTSTVYRSRQRLDDVLYLAISQSGGSPDLLDAVQAAREGGAFTVAVTNDPTSALAGAAHRSVDLAAGPELSVAATKTYTAELLALYLLLAPDPGSLSGLPAAATAALQHGEQVDALAARYRYTDRLVTTGRGYAYPSAREAALKLMETCYLSAQAFSGADLLHGPLAMVDAGVPVLAVLPPGAAGAAMVPVLEAIRGRGADVATVGSGADLDVGAPGLPEAVAPLLEILPLQQMALSLALSRGGDPDRPRGLRKVTETW
jgi:glucosamine--fructose-6-phosphate aminotransferase (isomerizing)